MGLPQFIAWATAQGFKNKNLLRQAYNSFKGKLPGRDVILKTARNLYDKAIAKVPTKKIADKIRQDLKKDRPFPGAGPLKVVPKEKSFIELMKEKGHKFLAKDTPEYLAHIKKTKPKRPSNIIPFPKKPPGKADGGRIDKALSTRSRDI